MEIKDKFHKFKLSEITIKEEVEKGLRKREDMYLNKNIYKSER